MLGRQSGFLSGGSILLGMPLPRILAFCLLCSGTLLRAQDDAALKAQLKAIAAALHGKVTLFAHNLRTGQMAALMPEEPVQTASVINLKILLDAAVLSRSNTAA
jgi:hypothetical protein